MTVSGLSSGGFIAHQFHIAYSDLVRGAGIVAGGPFGCAERVPNPWVFGAAPLLRAQAATLSCTHVAGSKLLGLPVPPPRVEDSLAVVAEARRAGTIAVPSHLAGTRVWLFRGEADELVPREAFDALASLYRRLGVAEPNLLVRPNDGPKAAHGMPVSDFPERGPLPARACGAYGPPFNLVAIGDAMNKGLTLRMNQCPVKRQWPRLFEHIRNGYLKPSDIVTHRIPLEHIAEGYHIFSAKLDGCIKPLIVPNS